MTAFDQYQRLEAAGLWRPNPEAQRTDVIVSIGDATLVITDANDRPLTHWSLAAVERANPGETPALYHPDGDPGETLELAENEPEMVTAIEQLHATIERRRPRPGRLRLVTLSLSALAVAALCVFWLPGAARDHAVSVVPKVKRAEIGAALMRHVEDVTGAPCRTPGGQAVLGKLARRLPAPQGAGSISVVRDGVTGAVHLPGQRILVSRTLVEDYEDPDVLAGFVVTERLRAEVKDPLADVLDYGGLAATIRLLATGDIKDAVLAGYAKTLVTQAPEPVETNLHLAGFKAWGVRSAPYAYALDVTGESTLPLIEADPYQDEAPPAALSDADWIRLQAICGS